MPKKSPIKIRKEEVWYRWECLKRNPDFLKDYNSCIGVEPTGPSLSEDDLCQKWGLDFVPDSLDINPLGEADVPVRLMDILKAEDTATVTVRSNAGPLFEAKWDKTKGGYDLRPRERRPYHKSFIKVSERERRWVVVLNPKKPLRLILEGIKSLPWEHRREGAKSKRAKRNIDLRLRVYDCYRQGMNFKKIAKTSAKSLSEVYALFARVCEDIGLSKGKKGTDPSFDSKVHFSSCPTCLQGRLCKLAETNLGLRLSDSVQGQTYIEGVTEALIAHQGRKLSPKINY